MSTSRSDISPLLFPLATSPQSGPKPDIMIIEMASPSPITIASLLLSPRRNTGAKAPVNNPSNIFTTNQVITGDPRWEATRDLSGGLSDSESDEDNAPMPSPTRMIKSIKNHFQNCPNLHAQKSAPIQRLQRTQTLAHLPTASNPDFLHPIGSNGALRERANSPNRRGILRREATRADSTSSDSSWLARRARVARPRC
jgi:hypothetical protein